MLKYGMKLTFTQNVDVKSNFCQQFPAKSTCTKLQPRTRYFLGFIGLYLCRCCLVLMTSQNTSPWRFVIYPLTIKSGTGPVPNRSKQLNLILNYSHLKVTTARLTRQYFWDTTKKTNIFWEGDVGEAFTGWQSDTCLPDVGKSCHNLLTVIWQLICEVYLINSATLLSNSDSGL